MNTANKLLDEAMKKLHAETDYQLHQKLGIAKARISEVRHGKKPTLELLKKLALVTGIRLDVIQADIGIELEKDESKKDEWRKIKALAAAIVLSNLVLTPAPSEAAPIQEVTFHLSVLC